MAEATTTRAPRTRRASKTTPAKAAPAKAAAKAEAEVPAEEMERIQFALELDSETKTYQKFTPPASSGCVGSLYVPKGTVEVKVLLIGPKG